MHVILAPPNQHAGDPRPRPPQVYLVPHGLISIDGHGTESWEEPHGYIGGEVVGVCVGHGSDARTASGREGVLEGTQER